MSGCSHSTMECPLCLWPCSKCQEWFVRPRTDLLLYGTYVLGKDRNKLVKKGTQKEDSLGCEEKNRWLWQRTLRWVCDPWKSAQRQWLLRGEAQLFEWHERGLYRPVFLIILSNSSWYDVWKGRNYCRNWVLPELITVKNYNIIKYSRDLIVAWTLPSPVKGSQCFSVEGVLVLSSGRKWSVVWTCTCTVERTYSGELWLHSFIHTFFLFYFLK